MTAMVGPPTYPAPMQQMDRMGADAIDGAQLGGILTHTLRS